MIPLYLGEIWAVDTFFLLPRKLKRLHSQRGVQYWGCSGPSDPAGFFFPGSWDEFCPLLPSTEFGVFVGYLLISATLQGLHRQLRGKLRKGRAGMCVYLCQHLPCDGGWCISPAQELGMCVGKPKQSYQEALASEEFAVRI